MTDVETPGPDTIPERPLRIGFDDVVWVAVVALGWFSLAGLALAAAGWFRPLPVAVVSVVGTIGGSVWMLPSVRRDRSTRRPHWLLTTTVVLLAVGSGLVNGAEHGEHLIAERDPGVYVASGLWLADHGNLRVQKPEGPFRDAPGVRQNGIGFSPNAAGSLDAQFVHLNAAFLAVGSWFGPTRLFLVPAFLMAGALVLLYALGARLGRPYGGAAAALAFAVSYPFVYVARDTYSEPLALVLLLAGLWALTFVRTGRLRIGVAAGVLLGATCLARIDGYIPLIPIAGLLALEYTVTRRSEDRSRARAWAAVWTAMLVVAAAGAYETWAFSRSYYDSNLGPRLKTMAGGIVAATVAGAITGRFAFRFGSEKVAPKAILRWGFAAVVVGVVAVLVWARYVRPDFAGLNAALHRDLTTVQLLPWAKTITYLWLEWYLGPILVAGAFAALLWMIGRGLLAGERSWLFAAGVGFSTTLLYLVAPSITPDQPWAMRRFVAVSIPLMLLAAGMAAESIGRLRPPWTVIGACIVGAVVLIAPAHVTYRFKGTSIGASLATRFNEICDVAHEEPSAILVTPGQSLGYTIPTALGQWCDVPVAGAIGGITPDEIHELSRNWEKQGRRLLLVSTSPDGISGVGTDPIGIPGPVLVRPEASVSHVPSRIEPDSRVAQDSSGVLPLFVVEAP